MKTIGQILQFVTLAKNGFICNVSYDKTEIILWIYSISVFNAKNIARYVTKVYPQICMSESSVLLNDISDVIQ